MLPDVIAPPSSRALALDLYQSLADAVGYEALERFLYRGGTLPARFHTEYQSPDSYGATLTNLIERGYDKACVIIARCVGIYSRAGAAEFVSRLMLAVPRPAVPAAGNTQPEMLVFIDLSVGELRRVFDEEYLIHLWQDPQSGYWEFHQHGPVNKPDYALWHDVAWAASVAMDYADHTPRTLQQVRNYDARAREALTDTPPDLSPDPDDEIPF